MSIDIVSSEFIYDPNDEFRRKIPQLLFLREANKDGYSIVNGRSILIIVHSKYLESFEFYTHEFTEITLLKTFQRIAEEDSISGEGLYLLLRMAHKLSPI